MKAALRAIRQRESIIEYPEARSRPFSISPGLWCCCRGPRWWGGRYAAGLVLRVAPSGRRSLAHLRPGGFELCGRPDRHHGIFRRRFVLSELWCPGRSPLVTALMFPPLAGLVTQRDLRSRAQVMVGAYSFGIQANILLHAVRDCGLGVADIQSVSV
jgi:hypothetical protein